MSSPLRLDARTTWVFKSVTGGEDVGSLRAVARTKEGLVMSGKSEPNVAVIRAFYEAGARGDLPAVLELVDPQATATTAAGGREPARDV